MVALATAGLVGLAGHALAPDRVPDALYVLRGLADLLTAYRQVLVWFLVGWALADLVHIGADALLE